MATGSINPLAGYNPPTFFPQSDFDVVIVAGRICPGICKISGFKRKWKWDAKGGKGSQGETMTYVMKHAVAGQLMFYVWTELQFKQWETFRPLFSKYDPTKQQLTAVTIFHPALADVDINQIVTGSIGPFEHLGDGLFACEVEVIEWINVPKASAVSTPTGSKSTALGQRNPSAPAPTDPQQVKIAQLVQQFQQT